jgi:hypothetical protein
VPVDTQLHQSYYVVAHLHYVLFGGSVFTIFAGIYYWFPKITGRLLNKTLGEWNFWTLFVGFNGTFLIMHTLGLEGMPRRIATYANPAWGTTNMIITISAVPHQRDPQLEWRGDRRRRPVAGQHAGMGHDLAPAALQLREGAAGSQLYATSRPPSGQWPAGSAGDGGVELAG